MSSKKYTTGLWAVVAFVVLEGLRAYKIKEAGFFDYDSVMNFLSAKKIAQGNFSMLFNHICPTFNLFYGFLYKLQPDFNFLQYINLSLNSIAIITFVVLFKKYFNLKDGEIVVVLLLIGSSLFMVGSSRYFSIDSLSFLLVVLVMYFYYESIIKQNKKLLYCSGLLVVLLFTVNYKSILLILVFVVIELIQNKRKFTFKDLLILKGIGFFFLIAFSVYGWIKGFSILRYLAGIAATFLRQKGENDYVSIFSSDFFYYFKYFLFVENPLIVVALLAFPILYRKELFSNLRELNSYQYFFILAYAFLAGMCLLAKAPRGIAFIYPILYLFLYLCIRRIVMKPWMGYAITVLVIIYQVWVVKDCIYKYSESNYKKAAAYITSKGITKIAETASIGILPYLEKTKTKTIFEERELADLKKEGYEYVIVDDFSKAANVNNFKRLYSMPVVAYYKSPSLLAPLVFLEESEYTGLSFEETMATREEAMKDTCQIRIVKLN